MARWTVAGLIVLNLILGIGVWLRVGGEKQAYAQIGAGRNYVSVSGAANGDTVIYVLESSTGKLVGIRSNSVDRKITLAGARNIAPDFARIR